MTVVNQGTIPLETPERVEPANLANVSRFPGVIGTFMGRDALSLAASHLGLSSDDTVLLPVYTCQEVLRSFVRNTQVLFYDVEPDLTINPDEVRAKLRGRRARMMLITNYFGFLQPYRNELKQICADRGICLIEDCAHSLLTEGSGDSGDLSIYSFRKILPLSDGGGLRVNGEGNLPVPKFFPRVYSDALSAVITAKSVLNIRSKRFSRARITSQATNLVSKARLPRKDDRILPLSHFAQRKMANISFSENVKKRRDDFQFWQEVSTRGASLVPVFGDLPPGVCPFGFPVRVKGRALLESRARNAGITLGVHWRLDAKLGTDCSISHEISTHLLTLPLYPELGERERGVLTGILAR